MATGPRTQPRKRQTAADRKQAVARRKLEARREETVAHIATLDQRAQALHGELDQLRDARSQMIGRLRLIQEDLGEAPPLTPAQPSRNGGPVVTAEAAPEEQ